MKRFRILISVLAVIAAVTPLSAQSSRSSRREKAVADSLRAEISRIRDSIRIADLTRSTNLEFLQTGKITTTDIPPTTTVSTVPETPDTTQAEADGNNPGYYSLPRMDKRTFETRITDDISDDTIIRRLSDLNCPFPLPYNEQTRDRIKSYISSRSMLESWLERADYWFPVFEDALRRYDIPSELKYLAVIESLLIPTAQSQTDAYGLWQFVQSTADLKLISIPRTSWRDDRFDPYIASDAAARLLRSDYDILGSWPLTILSYNCGCGKVKRAMKAAGSDDFWEIWDKLDYNEPKIYICLYVAAMYAMSYAEEHGIIGPESPMKAPLDTVMISSPLHFVQISEMTGISMEELHYYNPQYRQDYIKGRDIASKTEAEILRLPIPYAERFQEVRDTIFAYKRDSLFLDTSKGRGMGMVLIPKYQVERYRVGEYGKESPKDIASHFEGISASDIVKWNNLKSADEVLPYSTVVMLRFPNDRSHAHNSEVFRKHTVRQRETLSSIARDYKTTVDEILRVNEGVIKDKNNIPKGLVINIPNKK